MLWLTTVWVWVAHWYLGFTHSSLESSLCKDDVPQLFYLPLIWGVKHVTSVVQNLAFLTSPTLEGTPNYPLPFERKPWGGESHATCNWRLSARLCYLSPSPLFITAIVILKLWTTYYVAEKVDCTRHVWLKGVWGRYNNCFNDVVLDAALWLVSPKIVHLKHKLYRLQWSLLDSLHETGHASIREEAQHSMSTSSLKFSSAGLKSQVKGLTKRLRTVCDCTDLPTIEPTLQWDD